MNTLTFRVAVEASNSRGFHSIVPGMMVCGTGITVEETLENTKCMIQDYMPDSVAAVDAFGLGGAHDYRRASWHIIEIKR